MYIGRCLLIILFSLPAFSMDPPPEAPKPEKENFLKKAKRTSQSYLDSTKRRSKKLDKPLEAVSASEQASELNLAPDKETCKAFHKAIRKNDVEKVKMFLKTAPILVTIPRKKAIFPLAIAIIYTNEEIIMLLIEKGADVHTNSMLVDKSLHLKERSCIGLALEKRCGIDVIEALLKEKGVLSADEKYIIEAYTEAKEQFESNTDKSSSQKLLDSDISLHD